MINHWMDGNRIEGFNWQLAAPALYSRWAARLQPNRERVRVQGEGSRQRPNKALLFRTLSPPRLRLILPL